MSETNTTRCSVNTLLTIITFISLIGIVQLAAQTTPTTNGMETFNSQAQDACIPCECEKCCPEDKHCGCCADKGFPTDLSGTYTGRVTLTGGHEMSGQATLTITGNQFTLESEGMTYNGRITAVTTRGYTGAAFYFSDLTDPATGTRLVVNARARKRGDRLTLSPVPSTRTRMTFTPGGSGGGSRQGGRRGRGMISTSENTGGNSGATLLM